MASPPPLLPAFFLLFFDFYCIDYPTRVSNRVPRWAFMLRISGIIYIYQIYIPISCIYINISGNTVYYAFTLVEKKNGCSQM